MTKYIENGRYSDERVDLMLQEVEKFDIYSKLEQNVDANPENNYDLFCSRISDYIGKFNKWKHKSDWISAAIIISINTKDKQYKELEKTSPDTQRYTTLEIDFTTYKIKYIT